METANLKVVLWSLKTAWKNTMAHAVVTASFCWHKRPPKYHAHWKVRCMRSDHPFPLFPQTALGAQVSSLSAHLFLPAWFAFWNVFQEPFNDGATQGSVLPQAVQDRFARDNSPVCKRWLHHYSTSWCEQLFCRSGLTFPTPLVSSAGQSSTEIFLELTRTSLPLLPPPLWQSCSSCPSALPTPAAPPQSGFIHPGA